MTEISRAGDPNYIEPKEYERDIVLAVAEANGRLGLIGLVTPTELQKAVVSEKKLAARQMAQKTDHGDRGQNRDDVWRNVPQAGRVLVPKSWRVLPGRYVKKLLNQ